MNHFCQHHLKRVHFRCFTSLFPLLRSVFSTITHSTPASFSSASDSSSSLHGDEIGLAVTLQATTIRLDPVDSRYCRILLFQRSKFLLLPFEGEHIIVYWSLGDQSTVYLTPSIGVNDMNQDVFMYLIFSKNTVPSWFRLFSVSTLTQSFEFTILCCLLECFY